MNTATIAITSIAATVDKVSGGAVYHISFQLKETGGQAGATISSVLFTMPAGGAAFTATYVPDTTQRVPAGGSLGLGPINITDQSGTSTSSVSQVSVAVSFVDDGGHNGAATGAGSFTQQATFSVNGLVTDGTPAASGAMRDVLVEVIDGANKGLQTRSDASGNYAIAGIAPGSLTLSASTTGYATSTKQVNISGDTRVDFILPKTPGPPPTPLPPSGSSNDLVGTWTGTGVDSIGTIVLTWALSQAGSDVSGTVTMQPVDAAGSCNSCHRDKTGTFSGTINGTTLSMTMSFPGVAGESTPTCSATLTGTASKAAAGTLTASYSGADSCEVVAMGPVLGGTVVMTRSP